ncbi:DUF92 domain-containing protein, partial [Paenibacillus pasadenensis]|uniref:DUF92 domain-containing protein n=1 Tax=Paenibacillus pasadenensis TaxID=217090 RepID=UPI003F8010AB
GEADAYEMRAAFAEAAGVPQEQVAVPAPPLGALLAAGALAGLAGALADSWLGATFQVMYRCSACGSETERAEHCGRPAERVRGFAWMTNDAVNLVSSLLAGALAAAMALLG